MRKWRAEHPEEAKAKTAASMRKWRARHPEYLIAQRVYMPKWRAKNLEHVREFARDWAREKYKNNVAHAERGRAACREYAKTHPLVNRAKTLRYKANKLAAPGSHTVAQWMARVQFYGWRCAYCSRHLTIKTLTQDHRIALSRGGSNFSSNLVPACSQCNSSKGNRSSPLASVAIAQNGTRNSLFLNNSNREIL